MCWTHVSCVIQLCYRLSHIELDHVIVLPALTGNFSGFNTFFPSFIWNDKDWIWDCYTKQQAFQYKQPVILLGKLSPHFFYKPGMNNASPAVLFSCCRGCSLHPQLCCLGLTWDFKVQSKMLVIGMKHIGFSEWDFCPYSHILWLVILLPHLKESPL